MIRRAENSDLDSLTSLALALWPDHECEELKAELGALLQDCNCAFFLFFTQSDVCGFAQVQLRKDYVEGSSTSPVGYLEGIYVEASCRHQQVARQLLTACETWAKEKGCDEFASDCPLHNTDSLGFHLASGFKEAGRVICFIKPLQPRG